MQNFKYLHVMPNEKFITPFIEFIENNLEYNQHLFIIFGGMPVEKYPILQRENIIFLGLDFDLKKNFLKLSKSLTPYFIVAERIILHSLFLHNLVNYLFLHQSFLPKCNWYIWGGDLYDYAKGKKTLREKFFIFRKKCIVKKIAGIITYVVGDFELACQWYGAKGKYMECFMYPSNLYKEYHSKDKNDYSINIQIGNSADKTNNHLDIFTNLKKFKDQNIKIFAPLSYGDNKYAHEIADKGKEIFGDKFIPLFDFVSMDQYILFLNNIDIAIFSHNRQQALGNTITLLGLGVVSIFAFDVIAFFASYISVISENAFCDVLPNPFSLSFIALLNILLFCCHISF